MFAALCFRHCQAGRVRRHSATESEDPVAVLIAGREPRRSRTSRSSGEGVSGSCRVDLRERTQISIAWLRSGVDCLSKRLILGDGPIGFAPFAFNPIPRFHDNRRDVVCLDGCQQRAKVACVRRTCCFSFVRSWQRDWLLLRFMIQLRG